MGIQTIVQPPATTKGIGPKVSKSDSAGIALMFATSPIHAGTLSDTERASAYQAVLDADTGAAEAAEQNNMFPNYNLNFGTNAPNLSLVAVGGAGLPATPYVPNPVSPGADAKFNLSAQVAAPTTFAAGLPSVVPANPSDTSLAIAGQTLGDYIKGSSATSAGS
jgi:hypothetical protein